MSTRPSYNNTRVNSNVNQNNSNSRINSNVNTNRSNTIQRNNQNSSNSGRSNSSYSSAPSRSSSSYSLLQAEAVHHIHLPPADQAAPPTADPVAIQFLQEAPAADQCPPDLTAVAADHHPLLHIAADQYQEAVVDPTLQVSSSGGSSSGSSSSGSSSSGGGSGRRN